MNGDEDRVFEREAARLLRGSPAGPDAATSARLEQARRNALEAFDLRTSAPPVRRWQPVVGAVAAAVALAVALAITRAPTPRATAGAETQDAPDPDVLLVGDELELLEELEFYQWLGEDGAAATAADPAVSG